MYISNEGDENVGKREWQSIWSGFIKTLLQGTNSITVTEEAHISQEKQWNFWVLQVKFRYMYKKMNYLGLESFTLKYFRTSKKC